MLKIENTQISGLEGAIRGMRNPKNSWKNIDSCYCEGDYILGDNDLDLATRLASGGSDDRKFLRMIHVQVDITGPLYWWKEFDTYKVGTVANSCSTMHKLMAKKFELDDFSNEHLTHRSLADLSHLVDELNLWRDRYLNYDKHDENSHNAWRVYSKKDIWWQVIQLLPSSYNQKRTIDFNYEVIRNMYNARKNHKLDEWSNVFCGWVKTLPYADEFITMDYVKEDI